MSALVDSRPAARTLPYGAAHPATFSNAMRSERIKLTSTRSTKITLLVAVVLGVGLGAIASYISGSHYHSSSVANKATWDPTALSLGGIQLAQLAIAVLGVLVVTSEYATGLIRVSLTAVPRRTRFLVSKASVYTAVALVVGEVTSWAAYLLGQALIGTNAPHTTLATPGVLRAVVGAGLYLAVIGLLGTAIGTLVRHTAAGVGAIVALVFVLPLVAASLPASWSNPLTEYWPTLAGGQILVLQPVAHTLPPWPGFGVFLLFTAVVVTAAGYALNHRDA